MSIIEINLCDYNNLILDCDGVMLDSNFIKEENIKKVVSGYLKNEKLNEFLSYFTQNNGLPREIKIRNYFNEEVSKVIEKEYSDLNRSHLFNASLTEGYEIFHNQVLSKYKGRKFVLSGGLETEVIDILKHKLLIEPFERVCGGPVVKSVHLSRLQLQGKTLYIGDSALDYEVAKSFNFDFIFLFGYTQLNNWREFTEINDIVSVENWSKFRIYV